MFKPLHPANVWGLPEDKPVERLGVANGDARPWGDTTVDLDDTDMVKMADVNDDTFTADDEEDDFDEFEDDLDEDSVDEDDDEGLA